MQFQMYRRPPPHGSIDCVASRVIVPASLSPLVGSRTAVGTHDVTVGVGVSAGTLVAEGGMSVGVEVGGTGVAVAVGVSVGALVAVAGDVAVSIGFGVLVDLGVELARGALVALAGAAA